MLSLKNKILGDIRQRLLWVGGFVAFFVAAGEGYEHYKHYAWPTAEAAFDKIEPRCVYEKPRIWKGSNTEYLDCADKDAAAKLIANGYSYSRISNRVWVVYEAEAGRKTYAIIGSWPEEAGTGAIGTSVRVRYSPSTPSRVEFAAEPGREGFVVAFLILVATGIGHLAAGRGRKD